MEKDYTVARKNYNIVSRIMLGAFLLLWLAEWLVTAQPAHRILRYIGIGFGSAYIILAIAFYAMPGLFDNKLKEQHG